MKRCREEGRAMQRQKGPNSVKVTKVIEVKTNKGLGIDGDPIREVIQYWDMDGNFLAEKETDPTLLCDLAKWESERLKKVIEDYSVKSRLQLN